MVVSLNRETKIQANDAVGVLEEKTGKAPDKIDLERRDEKHGAEAKAEPAANKS